MKKLPLGIATLKKIITEGYTYVDKSRFVHELVETGSYSFLSRLRRFGKSLVRGLAQGGLRGQPGRTNSFSRNHLKFLRLVCPVWDGSIV